MGITVNIYTLGFRKLYVFRDSRRVRRSNLLLLLLLLLLFLMCQFSNYFVRDSLLLLGMMDMMPHITGNTFL